MGNQVRNGRNYKDSIIKLSLNSFSTNSAIHDNLSSFNDKKLKYLKNFGKLEENYFSKFIPTEKINNYNKKAILNNNNKKTNKENIQINSRNDLFSQKNKIIFISTYSSQANKLNNNKFNKSQKNEIKNKEVNTKTIYTEFNKNIITNKNIEQYQGQNSNQVFLYDIFNKKNIQNEKKKILNLNDSLNYPENENKSSINSSKFINFDIVNEKISVIDGLELTEFSYKNVDNEKSKKNVNKNQDDIKNNNKQKKEGCYEMEFEDYITKLNLGDVNIDRELFERPLFYNRSKKLNTNKGSNKLKNYFKTNNCENKISPDSLEKKSSFDINNKKKKNYSLRNSIKKNNRYNNKKLYQSSKGKIDQKYLNFKSDYKGKNKNKINRNNNIQNSSVNSYNKSRKIQYLNEKKETLGSPKSKYKLLVSNNLYNTSNINEDSSFFNQKYNSKKKEIIHKDYFNFKKLIKKNFNNINNIQISDFLINSKKQYLKIKCQRNFQKSANNSLQMNKGSPLGFRKLDKMGRNIFSSDLKSNFQSVNLSKSNNMNTVGNSIENNIFFKNIIDEQINKKNCNIIRIFKNKNNLGNKNKNKIKNKDLEKIKNNSNPINKIKCNKFTNKRSCSSMNIFEEKSYQNKIFNKQLNKKNKDNLIINSNNYESIKKRKISQIFHNKQYIKNEIKQNLYKNANNRIKIPINKKLYKINKNFIKSFDKNISNIKIAKIF